MVSAAEDLLILFNSASADRILKQKSVNEFINNTCHSFNANNYKINSKDFMGYNLLNDHLVKIQMYNYA